MENKEYRELVVVYQLGKVASTSIVNSLNKIDYVNAIQSHFLGRDGLRSIMDTLTDPTQSEYFYSHRLGQFLANLEVTRQINGYKAGHNPEKRLTFISLVRDPLDWFRSSFAQDILGYIPFLRRYADAMQMRAETDEVLVGTALPAILSHIHCEFEKIGGVDAFFSRKRPFKEMFIDFENPVRDDLIAISCVFIRPFSWLDDHLANFLEIPFGSFTELLPNVLWKDLNWCGVYVIRYEDLPDAMRFIAKRMGIQSFVLGRDNTSDSKVFSREINASFETDSARKLASICKDTDFYRRFYDPAVVRSDHYASDALR